MSDDEGCTCGIDVCRVCHPERPVEPVTVEVLAAAYRAKRKAENEYLQARSWMGERSSGLYRVGGHSAKARRRFTILMCRAAGLDEPAGGVESPI